MSLVYSNLIYSAMEKNEINLYSFLGVKRSLDNKSYLTLLTLKLILVKGVKYLCDLSKRLFELLNRFLASAIVNLDY